MRIAISILLILLLADAAGVCGAFELVSTDFAAGGMIPALHTCDGKNISPHLAWRNPPQGTKSFALICHDPDAPVGTFIHWIVYDIPAGARELTRNGPLPPGARQLHNDFGTIGYGGPCPPSGTHRYIFTLYGLAVERLGNVTRETIAALLRQHQTGTATLTGLYERRR
ncbi:MAG: YbhB/YbcL family Raf kinase inhibitor-like protein [Desulfobacterota bacterium]|nr:YbhB/YbcL family Raf kinase inhibitor-like protein [Thermodesulfobacteriota bacterium]